MFEKIDAPVDMPMDPSLDHGSIHEAAQIAGIAWIERVGVRWIEQAVRVGRVMGGHKRRGVDGRGQFALEKAKAFGVQEGKVGCSGFGEARVVDFSMIAHAARVRVAQIGFGQAHGLSGFAMDAVISPKRGAEDAQVGQLKRVVVEHGNMAPKRIGFAACARGAQAVAIVVVVPQNDHAWAAKAFGPFGCARFDVDVAGQDDQVGVESIGKRKGGELGMDVREHSE